MFFKVMLLIAPVLARGIKIQIQPSAKNGAFVVQTSGSHDTIISDSDRSAFQIDDTQLKRAISLYNGGNPTNVYVRSPTPWNDLYTTWNWGQIKRTITATSAKIIRNSYCARKLISEYEFINNSSIKAFKNENLTSNVENTVSHTWTNAGELIGGFSVDYAIHGPSMSLLYSNTWGSNFNGSRTVTFAPSEVHVEVMPGQTVTASLKALACTMKIEVNYVAKLNGDVASNFEIRFEGHHFLAYNINAILEKANLPREIEAKEIINVNFFKNGHIIVKDKKSNVVSLKQLVGIRS